jgi:hypothetical protein
MPNSAAADIDRRVKVIDGEGKDDRTIERVSDLRAMPFVVLLGEPGIGKSTVLAREAANEGASVISVRELMTGTKPQPDATLFLDALDEYRTDGGAEDKVHTLANAIAGCDPPRWRMTCRSEDWRKAADIAPLGKTTDGRRIMVVQLLPLDLEEASKILAALGEVDTEQFLKNAAAYGATGFIENPLGLKLLQNAVADGGTWPANRFQLFASATQKLAFERSAVRSVIERHGVNEILDAAATLHFFRRLALISAYTVVRPRSFRSQISSMLNARRFTGTLSLSFAATLSQTLDISPSCIRRNLCRICLTGESSYPSRLLLLPATILTL